MNIRTTFNRITGVKKHNSVQSKLISIPPESHPCNACGEYVVYIHPNSEYICKCARNWIGGDHIMTGTVTADYIQVNYIDVSHIQVKVGLCDEDT
jgi:hypothetical protein